MDMGLTGRSASELGSMPHFSLDEVRETVDAFSSADWARLGASAHVLAQVAPIEPDDLLQTALERVLNGQRKWPRHVPAMTFLGNTMRSIASASAKAGMTDPLASSELVDSGDDDGISIELFEAPEDLIRRGQVLQKVMQVFAGDQAALDVLEGRGLGLEGEELRDLVGQDKQTFDATCKRIRRRYMAHFLDEKDHGS